MSVLEYRVCVVGTQTSLYSLPSVGQNPQDWALHRMIFFLRGAGPRSLSGRSVSFGRSSRRRFVASTARCAHSHHQPNKLPHSPPSRECGNLFGFSVRCPCRSGSWTNLGQSDRHVETAPPYRYRLQPNGLFNHTTNAVTTISGITTNAGPYPAA